MAAKPKKEEAAPMIEGTNSPAPDAVTQDEAVSLKFDPSDPWGDPNADRSNQAPATYQDIKAEAERRTLETGCLHEVRKSDIKNKSTGKLERRYFIVSGVGKTVPRSHSRENPDGERG